eukprot:766732-Hanusia_phi.AAC.2
MDKNHSQNTESSLLLCVCDDWQLAAPKETYFDVSPSALVLAFLENKKIVDKPVTELWFHWNALSKAQDSCSCKVTECTTFEVLAQHFAIDCPIKSRQASSARALVASQLMSGMGAGALPVQDAGQGTKAGDFQHMGGVPEQVFPWQPCRPHDPCQQQPA